MLRHNARMRFRMSTLTNWAKVLWGCALAVQLTVFGIMIGKKQYKEFPTIFSYVLISLLQSPVLYLVYSIKGYGSWTAYWMAWISQGIVVIFRWAAVCELCYAILGEFRGIWGLAWRVLAVFGVLALLTALLLGGHDFQHLINTFDLGLQFSIATVMVVLFLFARYYQVEVETSLKSIGIAFCLYSCFRSLNDTVLQTLWRNYAGTWTVIDEVTYVATLALIGSAVYVLRPQPKRRIVLLPQSTYAEFAPQVNERLWALNKRLNQLLSSKETEKA